MVSSNLLLFGVGTNKVSECCDSWSGDFSGKDVFLRLSFMAVTGREGVPIEGVLTLS